MDCAFRALDRIKPHINVWWTTGAQNTQILQSGEVAATPAWGGRAFALDGGAPITVVWTQGMYSADGWVIPRGTPRADLSRQFVRFCLRPEQQAIYTQNVANAPTAKQAFDYLAPVQAQRLATAPELQRRGLFRTDYEGATLRENLGLAMPGNRYTASLG